MDDFYAYTRATPRADFVGPFKLAENPVRVINDFRRLGTPKRARCRCMLMELMEKELKSGKGRFRRF